MIKISGLKLNIGFDDTDIQRGITKKLKGRSFKLLEYSIQKLSLDARDKDDIHYVCTVKASFDNEQALLAHFKNDRNISPDNTKLYEFTPSGTKALSGPPVIVGSGPCGLFAAYMLAEKGFMPVLIEQGEPVEERIKSVKAFWDGSAELKPESNVQFGEGGAGTFSDGKLNTGVNDPSGRNALVLDIFANNGADPSIRYVNKPHLGTDKLCGIVSSMRRKIIENGGTVFFNTKFLKPRITDGAVNGAYVKDLLTGTERVIGTEVLILAPGHSSRDTFRMLAGLGVKLEAKPFAAGIRIQHPQKLINESQYGEGYKEKFPFLPPSDYKLTTKTKAGRSVYSFCMCPGGLVVNSSSEAGGLCINGMSYSDRAGANANSAIIVNVTPADCMALDEPLNGVRFQEMIEQAAFKALNGLIPTQLLKDFKESRISAEFGSVTPEFKGNYGFADINGILPEFICDALKEAIGSFGYVIKGFDNDDAILAAPETRTSSPVRILRDAGYESNVKGLFPCGEGAGYAGGITSAAIDGVKVSEEIMRRFRPF